MSGYLVYSYTVVVKNLHSYILEVILWRLNNIPLPRFTGTMGD